MSFTPQSIPDISLIIPLYNAERYICPCLNSVLGQSYKNFECLLINDGSTDNTAIIIAEYAARDPRFIIINQENQGCSEARNTGIQAARGAYLAFLDQDDLFHPQALQTLHYLIETHGTDIAGFTYQIIDDGFVLNETVPTYDLATLKTETTSTPLHDFYYKAGQNSVVIWTRIYRKSVLGDVFFPKDVQPAEDTVYSIKALHKAKTMVQVIEPLLFYRDGNVTSVMSHGITEKYIRAHQKAALSLHIFFREHENEMGSLMPRAMSDISKLLYKSCIAAPLKTKDKAARKQLLKTAFPLVNEAYIKGYYNPKTQGLKKQFVSHLFQKGLFELARLLA